MAPPVNQSGLQQGVSVLIVSKENDVMSVEKGSKVMNVMSVSRGSREMIVSNVPPDSRVTTARNVQMNTTEIIVVNM